MKTEMKTDSRMEWTLFGIDPEQLGYIPFFLYGEDARPAKEQFDERYAHGGGWFKFEGFVFDRDAMTITYPAKSEFEHDEIYTRVAETTMPATNERVIVFNSGPWVMILQENGEYEIARMEIDDHADNKPCSSPS